jgi:integrase/recombinase XerD
MANRNRRHSRSVEAAGVDPQGFGVLSAAFLEWMRLKNYSPYTVAHRGDYLRYFICFCEERGITQPKDVTKAVVERYQRWLYHYRRENGQPLSFSTQHTRLVPVKAFFKWLAKNNHILYNPASEMELPKKEKRLPRHVLSAQEAEAVINQPDIHDPLGLRNRAVLEVLYSTGMRRMELIGLKLYDLDVEHGTVMIRQGKGKKDRMIPIGDRAMAWVEKYLREVRPGLVIEPDDGTLFLTTQGHGFATTRITQMVREYVDKAQVGKRGSCHLFRHTMATLMLENGADIRFIQQMLGHAELSTTQIYTQVSIRKLKEVHTATHPAKLQRSKPEDGLESSGQAQAPTGTHSSSLSAV